MRKRLPTAGLLALVLAGAAVALPPGPSPEQQASMRLGLLRLGRLIERAVALPADHSGRVPDVEVFRKGVRWALDYQPEFTPADVRIILQALDRGIERAESLLAGRVPWEERRGRLVLGYGSAVDGSVQPYGLIVPAGYRPGRPMRLDVVLHGSTRPVGMSELRFMLPFDEGDGSGGAPPPAQDWIELRPLGRVENCYRWAGETDVFEAIADVCRRYTIDRGRIVLRGMSMGASGTWHLGLKHPDSWAALGPYCGYVDTLNFSRTPLPNFIPVGPLPPHQERILPLLDSVGYAANAEMVPAVAAMGEKDVFFQAHVLMGEAFRREGLAFTNLISPGTGHVQDPVTHAEQMRRIAGHVAPEPDRNPDRLRFVTHSLRYPRCRWLEILGLERHYERAEVRAGLAPDGVLELHPNDNVRLLAVAGSRLNDGVSRIRIAGRAVEPAHRGRDDEAMVFARAGARWQARGRLRRERLQGKRPGVQGPIDDAFMSEFLCVRGTGTPWHRVVDSAARARLGRFAGAWRQYWRGDCPVADDDRVTAEELRSRNVVLFGDPGSNRLIREALPHLPLHWDRRQVRLGGSRYRSERVLPVLIAPSPWASDRYVVLNTGHSFGEKELASLNYLLFPRLGDWAVLDLHAPPLEDGPQVLAAGFFDERWR